MPKPPPRPLSPLSAITPPSYFDDGVSIEARMPSRSQRATQEQKSKKQASKHSRPLTSTYTGSFVDDGADMQVLPKDAPPGLGPIDPKFYEDSVAKEQKLRKGSGLWNADIQKAVSGDIRRSLEKIQAIGNAWEIRKGPPRDGAKKKADIEKEKEGSKKNKEEEKEQKPGVLVPIPPTWGPWLIKNPKTGRVIFIDQDGYEYDSGVPGQKEGIEKKWVRAASTVVESPTESRSLPPPLPPGLRGSNVASENRSLNEETEENRMKYSQPQPSPSRKDDKPRSRHSVPSRHKHLTSVPEEQQDDGMNKKGEGRASINIPSPREYFMTGGATGWHSLSPFSTVATPAPSNLHSPSHSQSAARNEEKEEEEWRDIKAWIDSRAGSFGGNKEGVESAEREKASIKSTSRKSHNNGSKKQSARSRSNNKTWKDEANVGFMPGGWSWNEDDNKTASIKSWAEDVKSHTSKKSGSKDSWKREDNASTGKVSSDVLWGRSPPKEGVGFLPWMQSRNPAKLEWVQSFENVSMPKRGRHSADNGSTRTRSTYKAPTVEDAPETPLEEKNGWGDWAVTSEKDSGGGGGWKDIGAEGDDWQGGWTGGGDEKDSWKGSSGSEKSRQKKRKHKRKHKHRSERGEQGEQKHSSRAGAGWKGAGRWG